MINSKTHLNTIVKTTQCDKKMNIHECPCYIFLRYIPLSAAFTRLERNCPPLFQHARFFQIWFSHLIEITWKPFPYNWYFVGETVGDQYLYCKPEQPVEQTAAWDAIFRYCNDTAAIDKFSKTLEPQVETQILPEQNDRHFVDDIFNVYVHDNVYILIQSVVWLLLKSPLCDTSVNSCPQLTTCGVIEI